MSFYDIESRLHQLWFSKYGVLVLNFNPIVIRPSADGTSKPLFEFLILLREMLDSSGIAHVYITEGEKIFLLLDHSSPE